MQTLHQGKRSSEISGNLFVLVICLIFVIGAKSMLDEQNLRLDLSNMETFLSQIKEINKKTLLSLFIFIPLISYEILICLGNILLSLKGQHDYLRIDSYGIHYFCITNIWGKKTKGKIKWTDIEQITAKETIKDNEGNNFAIRVNTRILITYRNPENHLSHKNLFYEFEPKKAGDIYMEIYKNQKKYCRVFDDKY